MKDAPGPFNISSMSVYARDDGMVGIVHADGSEAVLPPGMALELARQIVSGCVDDEFQKIVRSLE